MSQPQPQPLPKPLEGGTEKTGKKGAQQPATERVVSPYVTIAEKYKLELTFRPFIKTEMVSVREYRDQKIAIEDYTAICFTSTLCIDYFFRMVEEARIPITDAMKYYCLNETTANYLQRYINFRKRKVFNGSSSSIPDMMVSVRKHMDAETDRFLIVRPETGNEEICAAFDKLKVNYKLLCICRTVSNDFKEDEPFDYDMILFFSPHGVEAMHKNFPDWQQDDVVIGCNGVKTAQTIRDLGYRLDIEVPNEKYKSLSEAVDKFVHEANKRRS